MESGDRRTFLGAVAACAGAGVVAGPAAQAAEGPKAWTDKDRIEIGGKGKEIIEKARALGAEYMSKYGNCAQSSLAALQDSVPFVPKDEVLFMAAAPLSGGATRTRNASCGAFTGAGLAIGSLCGRTRANFSGKAPLPGQLILEVHDKFVESWGCVLCNDIRTKVDSKCAPVVSNAAGWAAEVLLKQFTDYKA